MLQGKKIVQRKERRETDSSVGEKERLGDNKRERFRKSSGGKKMISY